MRWTRSFEGFFLWKCLCGMSILPKYYSHSFWLFCTPGPLDLLIDKHELMSIIIISPKELYDWHIISSGYLIRLHTENSIKIVVFSQKMTFIRTRYRQNQCLWCQNGVKMSPENQGVFQLLKDVTFRRILAFCNSRK